MLDMDQSATSNLLLRTMAAEDFARLEPHFERVELDRGMTLVRPNRPVDHVYFPEGSIASIVSETSGRGRTEVGIFGSEGCSATFLLLGATESPLETFIQVNSGTGLRIATNRFLNAVSDSRSLQLILLRYVHTMMIQTAQNAASNAHQRVEARLARWLLMCHDRVDGDEIAITHEFMSMMVAAERSGVTVTLHVLEGAGAIHSLRGRVIIRDRKKLVDLAGDGYGMAENEYTHLLTAFGKGSETAGAVATAGAQI